MRMSLESWRDQIQRSDRVDVSESTSRRRILADEGDAEDGMEMSKVES